MGSTGASGIDIANPSEESESCGAGTRLKCITPLVGTDSGADARGDKGREHNACLRYGRQQVDVDDDVTDWLA